MDDPGQTEEDGQTDVEPNMGVAVPLGHKDRNGRNAQGQDESEDRLAAVATPGGLSVAHGASSG